MQYNINTMAPMDLMGYRQLLESELGQLQEEAKQIMAHVAKLSGEVRPDGRPKTTLKKVEDTPESPYAEMMAKKLTAKDKEEIAMYQIKAQQVAVKMKSIGAKIAKCRKKLYE